jgi:hypothetical protein
LYIGLVFRNKNEKLLYLNSHNILEDLLNLRKFYKTRGFSWAGKIAISSFLSLFSMASDITAQTLPGSDIRLPVAPAVAIIPAFSLLLQIYCINRNDKNIKINGRFY